MPALVPLAKLGPAALAAARADLGVRETSPNRGSRVDQMLANVGLDNASRSGDGYPWCAAATTTWIQEGSKASGVTPPIEGSAMAQEIMRQLQAAKRWTDAADLGDARFSLRPGMVLVWTRGPTGSGLGHVGVVDHVVNAGNVVTIEGNSGPTGNGVYEVTRSLSDPRLLGAGWLDEGVGEVPTPKPKPKPPRSDQPIGPPPADSGPWLPVAIGLTVTVAAVALYTIQRRG